MTNELINKVKAVNDLGTIIAANQPNVEKVEYLVLESAKYPDSYIEYLCITYKGGAKSYRACTGNSFSAIFEEIAGRLRSGSYEEASYFNRYLQSGWKIVEVNN